MAKIYALLVGIDAYVHRSLPPLSGCVNDACNVEGWLRRSGNDVAIEMLLNADATYDNVKAQICSHLGRAGPGEVALLHYAGHGAHSLAAPEFAIIDATGTDEGICCIDSRDEGRWDLSDKELAVLVNKVVRLGAEVVVSLDCCHSGSGTRAAISASGTKVRSALPNPRQQPRPLETYIDGFYKEQLHQDGTLSKLPMARHILMAACERRQVANEVRGQGLFTTALVATLERCRGDVSYAELYLRTRTRMREMAFEYGLQPSQDPQFEPIAGFNSYGGYVGRTIGTVPPNFELVRKGAGWELRAGAIQGLPVDPDRPTSFEMVDSDGKILTRGETSEVGAQKSVAKLEAEPSADIKTARARVTSLPAAPLAVVFVGDDALRQRIDAGLASRTAQSPVVLVDGSAEAGRLALVTAGDWLELRRGSRLFAHFAKASGDNELDALADALRRAARWERTVSLVNPRSGLDASLITFVFDEAQPGRTVRHEGPEAIVPVEQQGDDWAPVMGSFVASNRSDRDLYATLFHLGDDYSVTSLLPSTILPRGAEMKLWTATDEANIFINAGASSGIERLKLIVSTAPLDGFLLEQPGIFESRGVGLRGMGRNPAQGTRDDWISCDLALMLVGNQQRLGPMETRIGNITIAANAAVKADISLVDSAQGTRGAGMVDLLAARGLAAIPLSGGSRVGAEAPTMISFNSFDHPDALTDNPIRLTLDVPVGADEAIVPLAVDGEYLMIAGDSWTDAEGRTQIRISELPESAAGVRGLGGALRMYFCKAYLKSDSINRLRRVSFDDGIATWHDDAKFAVQTASRVLLIIHGIIGDTAGIAPAIPACGLDKGFDLVLSYDYENLNTPIETTAALLKAALLGAGFGPDDGKSLTILAHSMGGLVSRSLVEQQDGAGFIDHLVMCGTPNGGSPFGKVGDVRRLLKILAGLAVNVAPQFASPALMVLSRSAKVTGTLEQMNPGSPFLATLNAGAGAGVRYTVLAGDIDAYDDGRDGFFSGLVTRLGRGAVFDALFGQQRNDIAVAADSILHVKGSAGLVTDNVACHHLNYFTSPTGVAALRTVVWG